ncbi:DUF3299 domain-containing protein [Halovulum sp. GXIMD14794]
MRAIALAVITAFLSAPAWAGPPLDWAELVDQAAQTYEDPYLDLTLEQLEAVRTVARFRASGEAGAKVSPDAAQRATAAEAALEGAGIDVDWIISQRWVVAERRERAAIAGNAALDGEVVTLAGFAIPAPPDADGEPTAYLVPERGMCSHMPPPQPNQMVQMSLPEGWTPETIHQPVLVTGALAIDPSAREIVVVDGVVPMRATFAMEVSEVQTPFRPAPASEMTNPWVDQLADRLRASGVIDVE